MSSYEGLTPQQKQEGAGGDAEQSILFPEVLSAEETDRILLAVCDSMGETLKDFTETTRQASERKYFNDGPTQDMSGDMESEIAYHRYATLRDYGFTVEEIAELAEGHRAGNLMDILVENIKNERANIEKRVELSRERIHAVDQEIHTFFDDMKTMYPRTTDAPAVFFGKYQNLILGTLFSKRMSPTAVEGWAPAGTDTLFVKIETGDPDQPLSDAELTTYCHERFHTLPQNYVQRPEEYIPLRETELRKKRYGFLRKYGENETSLFIHINEGVTEFFTRQVATRLGYQSFLAYDKEVESLGQLLRFISMHDNSFKDQRMQELLHQYVTPTGLLAFKRRLEECVGQQGLFISEVLFSRPKLYAEFLKCVQKQQEGRLGESDAVVIPKRLFTHQKMLNTEQLLRDYPFVKID